MQASMATSDQCSSSDTLRALFCSVDALCAAWTPHATASLNITPLDRAQADRMRRFPVPGAPGMARMGDFDDDEEEDEDFEVDVAAADDDDSDEGSDTDAEPEVGFMDGTPSTACLPFFLGTACVEGGATEPFNVPCRPFGAERVATFLAGDAAEEEEEAGVGDRVADRCGGGAGSQKAAEGEGAAQGEGCRRAGQRQEEEEEEGQERPQKGSAAACKVAAASKRCALLLLN